MTTNALTPSLERTLGLIRRAAKAGQPLTIQQLQQRVSFSPNSVYKFTTRLCEMGLIDIDKSFRPYLIKPAAVLETA